MPLRFAAGPAGLVAAALAPRRGPADRCHDLCDFGFDVYCLFVVSARRATAGRDVRRPVADRRLFARSDFGRRSRPGTPRSWRRVADPIFRRARACAAAIGGRTTVARFGGHRLFSRPLAAGLLRAEGSGSYRGRRTAQIRCWRTITFVSGSRSSHATTILCSASFPPARWPATMG